MGWTCKGINLPLAGVLLHPSLEKKKHKKKQFVQSPNSYFMDVKSPGSYKITLVFSHAQTGALYKLFTSVVSANRRKDQIHRRVFM